MSRRVLIALGLLVLVVMAGGIGALVAGGDEEAESDEFVAFSEPPRIKAADGPIVLTAAEGQIVAGGQLVKGRAYNGQFIGPTLVFQPGETFNLELQNHLPQETTNLHYHGFHVSPEPPSDQVIHLHIPPKNGHYSYEVGIPPFHDQGTFWYHSHNHLTSEGQVFGGLAGVALIGTPRLPPGVKGYAQDRLLALKDFQVRDGEIPSTEIDSAAETTRTVNGLVNPQIIATPNTLELWRLANISADIFYDVELEGHPFYVLDEDGNPREKVLPVRDLVLPPGKRFDVLVQFKEKDAGSYVLKTLEYSTGPGGDKYPKATLATVNVSGAPAPGRVSVSGQLAADGLPEPTAPPRTKILTENEKTSTFMINGKTFDPERVDDLVELGDVEDWTFVNKTEEQHPIHIHQDDFWVIKRNGKPVNPISGQQDTVIVPPKETVTLRIPFTDYRGQFVYHCHILNHEDNGMMAVIEVFGPNGGRTRNAAVHDHAGHSHHDHSSHPH